MAKQPKHNLYRKGDTFRGRQWRRFYFSLIGVQVLIQFKTSPAGKSTFEYSTADGSLVIDELENTLTWLPRVMNYPAGIYYYDVQFTFPNGFILTLGQDKLIIFQDVSR